MKHWWLLSAALLLLAKQVHAEGTLPFGVVFKGREKFDQLVRRAVNENWTALPIGSRTATVGRALVGTPYKSFTLEIDDRVEAASVNFYGMDCWTFFEISLAFARMLNEPRERWTPQTMLAFVELDRYRNASCTGEYLSRLHYLDDWAQDNERRGLVKDLSLELGGRRLYGESREMTVGWKQYRYLRMNPSLLGPLGEMERRVTSLKVYYIPKSQVAGIESKLQDGDIIGITTNGDGGRHSHVGLATRDDKGVLRFMHASSPRNYGRVVIDSRLSDYLYRFRSHTGITVARPVR